MDNQQSLELARDYALIVRQEYPEADIYLFGSRNNGNSSSESDIDIAIIVSRIKGDWLDQSARLWKLRQEVSNYIEPVLLEAENDPSGFVEHIIKNRHKTLILSRLPFIQILKDTLGQINSYPKIAISFFNNGSNSNWTAKLYSTISRKVSYFPTARNPCTFWSVVF